ncbi:MAG: hypothetical protein WDN47_00320 [Candidatus Doudnabacteria bacterium]
MKPWLLAILCITFSACIKNLLSPSNDEALKIYDVTTIIKDIKGTSEIKGKNPYA